MRSRSSNASSNSLSRLSSPCNARSHKIAHLGEVENRTETTIGSHLDSQYSHSILVVHLPQNGIRQFDSVYSPAPLRWDLRRSIVEILVFGLQEAEVNFI